MKKTRVNAIDVGTTKVCTIMAELGGNAGPNILGVGVAPSRGLQKGVVVNLNDAKDAIKESIKKAEQIAGYKLESAYIGVTGRHITSTNNHGVVAITRGNQLVRQDDLERVLDVARTVKISADQKVLHVIPRTYLVDGQEGVKDPVGMHGFRLDVDAHIITASVTSMQNLTKCIRGIGVEIEDLVLEPLASAEAVLTEEEKLNGVMVADIGGGTTDIAVYKDNTIYHTSVLPVAGYQVTRDISVGLGISIDLAEEMKKKYGDVTPVKDDKQAETDKTLTADGHSISYLDLSEIIRIRMEELLRLVVLELPRSEDYNKLIPAGLVLTGGSTNLPGLAELGQEITGLPVRVGVPLDLRGVSDTLRDPAYATSVGLLLWKYRNENTIGPQKAKGMSRWVSQVLRMFR